ncbi:hypothetical protein BDP55DRAFT_734235 [Colletotrichum godetiae]|uniref:Uncharacterized protein n=1 Tax=Colletotrichum godetiae TaxID=1209918 RepID=A0AAJ0AAY7_9PEZI|nr:uncharacterized protein BDP55DRAFT_734235 [Colletotrichum godetiae]KAK1658241.1 hypothetical protein BDP55DRAFT_734235 [Colletotrichum godetiae]
MHLTTSVFALLLLQTTVALPTAKDNKVFAPTPDLPPVPVQDLGIHTGKIGVDNVDLSALRVDPVRVINRIQSSSHYTSSLLTKRRDVLLEEEDGRITIAKNRRSKDKRSHIQVDPVEVNVHIMRPEVHTMSNGKIAKVEGVQRETGKGDKDVKDVEPKPKYIPKFMLHYSTGGWFRHIRF